jgi:predicted RNA polymerase sigma factor
MSDAAARAAETAARASYGKLLAILSRRIGDIALAEDALADAFAKALATWPETGVPAKPDAWLMAAARNGATDALRRRARFPETDDVPDMPTPDDGTAAGLPDERLTLMMVCAHPALAEDVHAPLMLQTVLGVEARDIAVAFAVAPSAMAQRLVRAKRKIRDAAIPFTLPSEEMWSERMGQVRRSRLRRARARLVGAARRTGPGGALSCGSPAAIFARRTPRHTACSRSSRSRKRGAGRESATAGSCLWRSKTLSYGTGA